VADLENTFSWSLSRNRTFSDCPRRYWFHYYGSWGGWDRGADEVAQELYRLKNVTNLHLIAGDVVHRAIERTLHLLRNGAEASVDDTVAWCKAEMQKAYRESQQELWRESPKRYTRLFEHHYGPQPTRDFLVKIARKIGESVRTFFSSTSFAIIKETDPNEWLAMENLDTFQFEGTKVYAVPDFAVRHRGEVLLFDWKTGRKDARNNDQLVLYAVFAAAKWGIDIRSIRGAPVYLMNGGNFDSRPVGPEDVARVGDMMRQSIAEMKSRLDDEANNVAVKDKFAPTPGFVCRSCSFRGVCPEAS